GGVGPAGVAGAADLGGAGTPAGPGGADTLMGQGGAVGPVGVSMTLTTAGLIGVVSLALLVLLGLEKYSAWSGAPAGRWEAQMAAALLAAAPTMLLSAFALEGFILPVQLLLV